MDLELMCVTDAPDLSSDDQNLALDLFGDPVFGEDIQLETNRIGKDGSSKTCPSPFSDSGISSPHSLKSDDEFFEELFGECLLPVDKVEEYERQDVRDATSVAAPKLQLHQSKMNSAIAPTVVVVKANSKITRNDTGKDMKNIDEYMEEKNRKNALQAKLNREKKKVYVSNLEKDVKSLSDENKTLKSENEHLDVKIKSLEEEVAYLKGVLANQSALAGLLKNIPKITGVNLTSSFLRKRNAHVDHDYPKAMKRQHISATNGVCLHVDKDNISIEFCASCSVKAKTTAKDQPC